MYNLSFFGQILFSNIFTIKLDFAIKNSIFANLQIFFADSKSRAQELSNDVSFVICGHKTWDLEGEGQIDPPSVSWFSSTPAGIGLNIDIFLNDCRRWI